MNGAIVYALIVLTALILPTPCIGSAPRLPAAGYVHSSSTLRASRPTVVENGSPLVVLPLPAAQSASNLAFTPDGTVYFMNGSDELDRVSPDGAYAKISVPGAYDFISGQGAYGKIIYAHGFFWMSAKHGLVKVAPDGSRHRLYQLAATSYDVTLGPDGAIYATADAGKTSTLYRIDSHGVLTSTILPVLAGDLVSGSDGNLYGDYVDTSTGVSGIARVRLNGSLDLIPGLDTLPPLATSNGSLYFQNYSYDPTLGTSIYQLGRLDRNGHITEIPLPPSAPGTPPIIEGDLSVDKGGNLWTVISSYYGSINTLYQYNVYTSHFSKPIQPSNNYFNFFGGRVAVGPDDNIWWAWHDFGAQAIVAYVRHVLTLEPGNLILNSSVPDSFMVLETHSNGPWTAQSLNPAVAVVAPAISSTGAFSVTKIGLGTTSIKIEDNLGNISYELVTAL